MKTEVVTPHTTYPAHVRSHVESRLAELDRFFEGVVSLRASLHREHATHGVELIAGVRRGVVLVVQARAASLSAALADAIERMGRVLARHKDKLKGRVRAGA